MTDEEQMAEWLYQLDEEEDRQRWESEQSYQRYIDGLNETYPDDAPQEQEIDESI